MLAAFLQEIDEYGDQLVVVGELDEVSVRPCAVRRRGESLGPDLLEHAHAHAGRECDPRVQRHRRLFQWGSRSCISVGTEASRRTAMEERSRGSVARTDAKVEVEVIVSLLVSRRQETEQLEHVGERVAQLDSHLAVAVNLRG
jgi:hypothetical protein